MNTPLIWIAVALAGGVFAGEFIHLPFPVLLLAVGILSLIVSVIFLNKKLFFPFLYFSIFCLGWFYIQLALTPSPMDISKFAAYEPKEVFLLGTVATDPVEEELGERRDVKKAVLRVKKVKADNEWHIANGRLLVSIFGHKERLRYGDEVILEGSLSLPSPRRNPGCFDYRAYLRHEKIFAKLSTGQKDAVIFTGKNKSLPITRWLFTAKDRMEETLNKRLPPDEAGFLLATLLGERHVLTPELNQAFMATGTMHVIAISGLHVVLIAFILIIILKAVRIPRRPASLIAIALLVAYALIVGGRPSVVRAAIMASVFLLGIVINREAKIENALSISAIIILLWNPGQLFDVGFQLSFFTVIAIVYLAPKIEGIILPEGKWQYRNIWTRLWSYIAKAISVSLSSWLGILPVIAYYFYIFSPLTIPANIWAVPLSSLVLALGFTLLAIASILPFLASFFAGTAYLAVHILTQSVEWLASLKFGYWFLSPPDPLIIISYYLILIFIIEHNRFKLSTIKTALICLTAVSLFIWTGALPKSKKELRVTFLDVGHGDSMFIEFPGGGNMLVDGGEGGENDQGYYVLTPFLHHKGLNRLNTILLSHPHDDHLGGLITLLKNFKADEVFDNGMPISSFSYLSYRGELEAYKIKRTILREKDEIRGYNGVSLQILNPPEGLLQNSISPHNDNSLVVRIIYGDVSVLLCGDIEDEGIKNLLKKYGSISSTIVKLPHHGTEGGEFGEALLSAVAPEAVIVSLSRKDKKGGERLRNTLENKGIKVYQTLDSGAVTLTTDGKNYKIEGVLD